MRGIQHEKILCEVYVSAEISVKPRPRHAIFARHCSQLASSQFFSPRFPLTSFLAASRLGCAKLIVKKGQLIHHPVRRLIINADDFGLTSGVNRAIAEAHQRGIVTSTTLMAAGTAFAEAAALAKAASGFSVGCHIVLIDGSPVLSTDKIPSLLESRNPPRFRDGIARFGFRAILGRLQPAEIEAEAAAQIRVLQAAGIPVTHLDTHKHTHAYPQVLAGLLRAAKSCGVPAIRNPVDPIPVTLVAKRPGLWKRILETKTLGTVARRVRQDVRDAGLVTPDGTIGIAATGTLDESLFQLLIQHVPEGTWEFVCHPGYNDAQLRALPTRLLESRVRELDLLTSDAARQILRENRIELLSYRDLVRASRG
jgi:hopanoid biosynthesis associated protein HpnK